MLEPETCPHCYIQHRILLFCDWIPFPVCKFCFVRWYDDNGNNIPDEQLTEMRRESRLVQGYVMEIYEP